MPSRQVLKAFRLALRLPDVRQSRLSAASTLLPHRLRSWQERSYALGRWEARVTANKPDNGAEADTEGVLAAEESRHGARVGHDASDEGAQEDRKLPWFVDPAYADPSAVARAVAPAPPPPSLLPSFLHPLHQRLAESPFLDPGSIAYIDAKHEPDGMGSEAWADWVAVAQLRPGRERGLRGAVEGVRVVLARMQFGGGVRVEGLDNPASQWAMLDAGPVIVHIVTADAREAFDLEGVWTGRRRPEASSRQLDRP